VELVAGELVGASGGEAHRELLVLGAEDVDPEARGGREYRVASRVVRETHEDQGRVDR
jgi:hypothetical protein